MADESNSTAKLFFWIYFLISSWAIYGFVTRRLTGAAANDRYGLAVGVMLIGIDVVVLLVLWRAAYKKTARMN